MTIETGGGGGLTANQLNQHFWSTVWNVSQSQLQNLTNNSHVNPPKTMLLANDPDYAKLRVVRNYYNPGVNVGVRRTVFDSGWNFNISLGYNANSGKFSYGVGQGPATLPKLKGVRLIGAAYGNAWHGSLMVIER